ncbi:unnamed protein product, partial [Mesorhabditis belari]|uniref:N-acetylglucosaminylphosphatidylinositol deacetylase n=1 Tax=Mesorhabditis belari TaxID=2138241 RepID=A0AAF3J7X0_9BILA
MCFLAAISLLFVFIIRQFWFNRPFPTSLPAKVLLVIAHPDDETMFFAPTITELTKQGHRVFLLCTSTGDFYGQGQLRAKELREAVQFLGINPSDVSILDYDKFKDGHQWDHLELSDVLLKQIKLLDAEVIISFDDGGVSHHSNHISIFDALQELYSRGELPINTQVFCLDTVSVLRKYAWILDVSLSIVQSPFCYFATMRSFFAAWRAMRAHRSQLLWFRYLFRGMNELDKLSLLKRKKSSDDPNSAGEQRQRITITTSGNPGDRRIYLGSDRRHVTGRGRLDGGRLSFPAGGPARGVRFNASRDSRNFDRSERSRRKSEGTRDYDEGPMDPSKPQLKLVDPAFVPRGRGYFDHDSREKDTWQGNDLYDPRRDNGFRNDRRRDRDDDRGTSWRGFDRPNTGSSSFNRKFERSSAADGVWTHDKFFEIEGGGEEQENKDKPEGQPDHQGVASKDRRRSRSRSHSRSRSGSRERYANRRPADDRRGFNKTRGFGRRRRSPSPFRGRDRRH